MIELCFKTKTFQHNVLKCSGRRKDKLELKNVWQPRQTLDRPRPPLLQCSRGRRGRVLARRARTLLSEVEQEVGENRGRRKISRFRIQNNFKRSSANRRDRSLSFSDFRILRPAPRSVSKCSGHTATPSSSPRRVSSSTKFRNLKLDSFYFIHSRWQSSLTLK